MTLRRSPEVQFVFDQSVAAQDRVEQILQELKAEEAARQAEVDASVTDDTPPEDGATEPPKTPSV
jgi:hypothetical protein